MLMTPGDIVMMLNEMGGMRVQATSPSLGSATVRIQGMRGRYTRVLSDGLPLVGSKSADSACCRFRRWISGRSKSSRAWRRRSTAPARWAASSTCLAAAGERAGVSSSSTIDAGRDRRRGLFLAAPLATTGARRCWAAAIGSNERRRRRRLGRSGRILACRRPAALFWDGGNGRTFFATDGRHVRRSRRRHAGRRVCRHRRAVRGSAGHAPLRCRRGRHSSWSRPIRRDGARVRSCSSDTTINSARCSSAIDTTRHSAKWRCAARVGRHTWVAGVAVERDAYAPRELPQFAYAYTVPGVFAQDDVA